MKNLTPPTCHVNQVKKMDSEQRDLEHGCIDQKEMDLILKALPKSLTLQLQKSSLTGLSQSTKQDSQISSDSKRIQVKKFDLFSARSSMNSARSSNQFQEKIVSSPLEHFELEEDMSRSYHSDKDESKVGNRNIGQKPNIEINSKNHYGGLVNDALEQAGGFGRFQWFALIILATIRIMGHFHLQAFALLVMPPQDYSCQYDSLDNKTIIKSCSVAEVCQLKSEKIEGKILDFSYAPNTLSDYYLNNWFIQMDAVCEDHMSLNFICSANFIGFIFGMFFFPLPDLIGPKKTMTMILIPYFFTNGLVAYGTTIFQKTLGMFFQGVLHIRITQSYVHMYGLVREKDKPFVTQIINLNDTVVMAITGFVFLFVTRDATYFIKLLCIFQTICSVLYILFIPESPRWLILNNRQEEGIDVINYIAFFNGGKTIPKFSQFSLLGQINQQKECQEQCQEKEQEVLKAQTTSNILSLTYKMPKQSREIAQKKDESTSLSFVRRFSLRSSFSEFPEECEPLEGAPQGQGVISIVKSLICEKKSALLFFKCMIMLTTSLNCLFLSLYQSRFLEANKFYIAIIIGVGQVSGNLLSGFLLRFYQDKNIYVWCLLLIILMQASEVLVIRIEILFFFFQVLAVGAIMNIQMIILTARMDPTQIPVSLGISFCLGSLVASTSPELASMPQPVPFFSYFLYCILGIMAVSTMGNYSKKKQQSENQKNQDPESESPTSRKMISNSTSEKHPNGKRYQQYLVKSMPPSIGQSVFYVTENKNIKQMSM